MKENVVKVCKKSLAAFLAALMLCATGSVCSPIVAEAVTSSSSSWHSLHRFTVSGKDAFCIHFNGVASGKTITFKTDSTAKKYYKNLGSSKQTKINKILTAANELGYLNNSSNAKYFAIQRCIWKVTDGNVAESKNTDNMKKFRRDTQPYFDKMQKAYPSIDVSAKPNISTITLNSDKNYVGTGTDKNKVLSDWKIKSTGDSNLRATITGNKLIVDGSDAKDFSGTKTIKLARNKPVFSVGESQVGRFNDQEAIMTAGAYKTPTSNVHVKSKRTFAPLDPEYAQIVIKKIDDNSNPISGVKFIVKYRDPEDESDIKQIPIYTDASGIAKTADVTEDSSRRLSVWKDPDDHSKGKIQYSVQEAEYNDDAYVPNNKVEGVSGITLSANEVRYVSNIGMQHWVNTEKRGDVKIVKSVETANGSYKDGAEFKFRLSGTSLSGKPVEYESTTNEKGVAYFCNVPVGSYKVTEVQKDAYIPVDAQDVDIEWDGVASRQEFSTDEKDFQESKTLKYFLAEDSDDENTDLDISGAEEGDAEDSEVEDSGYTGDTAEYVAANVYQFKNHYKRGDLKIEKHAEYVKDGTLDIETAKGEGFQFEVSSKAANNVTGTDLSYTVETDENGVAYLNNIPVGTYKITESSEQAQYVKLNTVTVTVKYDGEASYDTKGFDTFNPDETAFSSDNGYTLSVTNKYIVGSVKGVKVDQDGKPLEGVLFGLFKADNEQTSYTKENALKTVTTAQDGSFEIKNVPYGEYKLVELKAKEGYVLTSEPIDVNITENGQVVELKVKNNIVTGKIQITKTDVSTGKTIPNCQIEILDAEKNVIKRGTTDANGKVEFTLTYGTYYYREFKAPEGYVLDTTPHMFKISKDGQIIKAIMTNEAEKKKIVKKKEHKKVETGSNSVWFIATGVVCLIAGAAYLIISRKKDKKTNK